MPNHGESDDDDNFSIMGAGVNLLRPVVSPSKPTDISSAGTNKSASAKGKSKLTASKKPKALAKKKSKNNWQDRQKAGRELQAVEKTLGCVQVILTSWAKDDTSLVMSEVTGLEKRIEKHLGEPVRWIFLGDDLDELDDAFQPEVEKRDKLLEGLRNSDHQT